MLPKAIIIDIDNVLLDSVELEKLIPPDNSREGWDNFHKHLDEPKPILEFVSLVQRYIHDHDIFFITSREDIGDCREITEKSINRALFGTITNGFSVNCIHLLMRPAECYSCSIYVKSKLYDEYIAGKYHVDFTLDDSADNARMWKEKGIISLLRVM
jgi:hypothetical protein